MESTSRSDCLHASCAPAMVSRETMAVYQIDDDAPALDVFLLLTSHAQSLENAATLIHQVASHYEMNNAFGRNCTR